MDAITNGGLGAAFFSPFDKTRYFFPWRPILVSPISFTRFFSERGVAAMPSELIWTWIPTGLLAVLILVLRRMSPQISPEAENQWEKTRE